MVQTTVEEALWLSCRLRFTRDVDNLTAQAFVNEASTHSYGLYKYQCSRPREFLQHILLLLAVIALQLGGCQKIPARCFNGGPSVRYLELPKASHCC